MSTPRSTLILFLVLILGENLNAQQKQIFFNASVLSQPDEFYFVMPHFGETSKQPAFEFNLGYKSLIRQSQVYWEGALSYQKVQATNKNNFASINDPAIPNELTVKYISNLLGVKAGIGHNRLFKKGTQTLSFSIGGSLYLPFFSNTKSRADDKAWNKDPMYSKDEFKYGIFYGVYFKPTYNFSLGQKFSPWCLSIFAEANLLWRNAVDLGNPLFMAGGGLGVSYNL